MRKIGRSHIILCFATLALALTPLQLMAASTSQMEACKIAALNKPKLRDFPMAAISVRPGQKPNRVAFTIQWDGAKGKGHCQVTPEGHVKDVVLKNFHDGGSGGHQSYNTGYAEQDDFYRDNSGQWRDPDGNVCHTCTPDNGFPDH